MVRTRFANLPVGRDVIGWKLPPWERRRATRSAQGRKFVKGKHAASPAAQRRKRRSLARRKAA